MSAKPRFVFDANTVISAALFSGSTPDQALRAAFAAGEVVFSFETFAELCEVLARPKFDRYLTRDERERFLAKLIERATLLEVRDDVKACRDPADDKYLALAIAGHATAIVSGDADLLDMKAFGEVPIHSPAAFLTQLKSGP
jgi:putative PIN family toxin of toxin-antitoxin system